MKTSSAVAFIAFLASSSLGALAAPAAPAAPATPIAKASQATILYLDRAAVLRQSAVGKDMGAQVEALLKKMNADFGPEGKRLQADVDAFQKTAAVLALEARQTKMKELEGRRDALQRKVKDREASIQAGLTQARTKVEQALGPILEKLMVERGSNLLLDRSMVVLGQNDLDVTKMVIGRWDAILPKVVVTPITPSAALAQPPGAAGTPPRPAAPAPGH